MSRPASAAAATAAAAENNQPRKLFDGRTLQGWHAVPRLAVPKAFDAEKTYVPAAELKSRVMAWYEQNPAEHARLAHTGLWEVKEGAITGGQNPPGSGLGAYLVSDDVFGDFELELDAHPDWPVDTGIMVRAHELGSIGFQILVDHRPNGGIGGVFGNSLGNFLAAPFAVDGDEQPGHRVANLRAGAGEPQFVHPPLRHAATFEEFARIWRPDDWNHFRIRCTGELPVIATWINGTRICELDTAAIIAPGYRPDFVRERLGRQGHIAFEVHDNGKMGHNRWAEGAVCRWKNITLRPLWLS